MSAKSHAAFAEAMRDHYGYLLRSLRRFGVATRDADDLAQDVLVAAYLKWPSYDPTRPVRPWLLGFAVRRAANYRRKNSEELADAEMAEAADPWEERDLVLRALSRLPFEQRVALVMHDVDGWSVPEISASIGVPENTVYSRIRLARLALRGSITAMQREEERA